MSDDIETLRGFIRQAEQYGQMFGGNAIAALDRLVADRNSLRKALDDRWSADLKAAKAIFDENADLRANLDRAKEALEKSITAIDDWLNVYASEFCDEKRVNEARERLNESGTLHYIATVQHANRAVLSELSADAPTEARSASEYIHPRQDQRRSE